MNKREDVLYLTLVDFFLQMLFLVMIALLAYIYVERRHNAEAKQFHDLAKEYKVDSVQELLDRLQTLAPIDNLENAKKAKELIDANGGFKEVNAMIDKFKEGQGKPPCVFEMIEGLKTPKSIATFVATNTSITLTTWQPEFEALAKEIKQPISINKQWSLRNFSSGWQAVLNKYPQCRYTVTLYERSNLVAPRDRVQGIFYTRIRK
ncbi:hypothetical protein [Acinetobacter terrae]|uniref:hypothetical protein n=1 Tax=Acinetobacter terrae TaxID=2731247 RepID=UPI0007D87317|nr:hypothetical protein [Acinetobacter terrae]OAL76335.1 hypothetical protein AY608_08445 [Acinetobacter terrae]